MSTYVILRSILNKLEMQGQFFKKSQEIILRYEKNSNDIFLTKKTKQTTT